MRTTRVLAIAAILGIAFSFRASANVVYDSETTNTWFSVDMSKLTTDALKSSPWGPPSPDGEAVVDHSVIKLDTDHDDPLTYTAEASADAAIVAAEMTATVNASEPDLNPVPQAALCVIGTASATNWVGLVGDGNGGTNWVTFSTPVPVAGETYSVRIEFDQRPGERKIRYRVGNTVLGDGWYSNPQNTVAANIKSVSFSGTGDISGLGGSNVVANAATFNGVGYQSFGDALKAAEAAGESWNNANPIKLFQDAEYAATRSCAIYVDRNGKAFTISGGVYEQNGNTYDITANGDCEAFVGETYYKTLDAALEAVLHVVLHQHGHIVLAGLFQNFVEAHIHQSHPVFQRPAVLVVTVIGIGRKELRNHITVPGVYFHRIESGIVGCLYSLSEVLCQFDAFGSPELAHESG